MKFEKGLLPHRYGLREFGLIFFAVTGIGCLLIAILSGLPSAALAALRPPSPTLDPANAVPTASPTALTLLSVPLPATNTPEPSLTPTAEFAPPTPIPSATRFYVIPAQPTPIPTPVLPPAAPFPASCDGPGRMNILLIGIDGFNDNYYRAARSDSIILVGVNFAAKTAQMLSVPRDLWVQLPNLPQVPEARINTAYHYAEFYGLPGGGPAEMTAVIANTFGLRVDRYVVVNFSAFEQGVDAIGGIDLNLPAPIHDGSYPLRDGSGTIAIDFPAGPVHMDGSTALIYARLRHDSNDFQRMRRQQQVLFAVRDKLLSPETLPQLPALAQVLFSSARTDLSLEDIALLGCVAPQVSSDAIQSWVIDSRMTTPTKLADGAQVLLPNLDAILPILENFNTGE